LYCTNSLINGRTLTRFDYRLHF